MNDEAVNNKENGEQHVLPQSIFMKQKQNIAL